MCLIQKGLTFWQMKKKNTQQFQPPKMIQIFTYVNENKRGKNDETIFPPVLSH